MRPPLNLLYLGTILLNRGFSVKLIDAAAKRLTVSSLVDSIIKTNCDVVGFTSMTANIDICSLIASKLKEKKADIIIILGGAHLTALKEKVFEEFPVFDIGVYGEGDLTIVELMAYLNNRGDAHDLEKIEGIIFKKKDNVVLTPPRPLVEDLDTLPMPNWELFDDYEITYTPVASRTSGGKSAYILTSRGCPFKCTFCFAVSGSKPRFYSMDSIFKQIDWHIGKSDITDLTVFDENLLLSKKRIMAFCDRLIEGSYNLTWSCSARANCVDNEVLEKMYCSGCRSIFFGIESGNEEILARYKKGLTHKQIIKAVNLASDIGIKVTGSFIIGGPQESEKTIRDSINFALDLPLDYATPFFYTPLPGTADYKDVDLYGVADHRYSSARMSKPNFVPHGMTEQQVVRLYREFLFRFYLRPTKMFMLYQAMGAKRFIQAGFNYMLSIVR